MDAQINIYARLLVLLQAGMTMPEAFDMVLGAGAYAKFAGDLYDALRGQA